MGGWSETVNSPSNRVLKVLSSLTWCTGNPESLGEVGVCVHAQCSIIGFDSNGLKYVNQHIGFTFWHYNLLRISV